MKGRYEWFGSQKLACDAPCHYVIDVKVIWLVDLESDEEERRVVTKYMTSSMTQPIL